MARDLVREARPDPRSGWSPDHPHARQLSVGADSLRTWGNLD
jgi:hypothetical protein